MEIQKISLNFDCDNESEEYKWFNLKELPDKTLDKKQDIFKWKEIAKTKLK